MLPELKVQYLHYLHISYVAGPLSYTVLYSKCRNLQELMDFWLLGSQFINLHYLLQAYRQPDSLRNNTIQSYNIAMWRTLGPTIFRILYYSESPLCFIIIHLLAGIKLPSWVLIKICVITDNAHIFLTKINLPIMKHNL